MSILRLISIVLILSFLFTGCSPQISQIEYDRKNYELEQLKIRYNLLQQEIDGNTNKGTATTKVSSEIDITDYNALQTNYNNLLKQNVALENAYNELKEQLDIPTEMRLPNNEMNPEVNPTAYDVLKTNYENLLTQYAALEKSYNSVKDGEISTETPMKTVVETTNTSVEYEKLKVDYEKLLSEKVVLENANKTLKERVTATKEIAVTEQSIEYDELQAEYETLLNQKIALEKDYKLLQDKQTTNVVAAPGTVPMTRYNELKIEKADIEKRFTILENRYNALNKKNLEASPSTIASSEILEPTELNPEYNISKGMVEREENSIDLGESIVQSASSNGLFFDFDTYTRTNEFLVLEVAVKNNSQSTLKTFWNVDKIEITDKNNNTYTSRSFRIGVDYVNDKNGTLLKKIDDENTVFARFAFEDLPSDLKHIRSLEFAVVIDGEPRIIKFTQIDVSNIEID